MFKNTRRILQILSFGVVILIGCKKDEEETNIKDQKSNYFFEQAFPGAKGEIISFISSSDTIIVEKIQGKYVFQGDMILTEEQLKNGSTKGAGLEQWVYRWIDNTVYYKINESLPDQSRITNAIKHYEDKTPIKFIKWTNQPNYVEFIEDENGVWSNVGMLGGRQEIGLYWAADDGAVIHEIGHTIGLIHEHSRWDRDQYIKINLGNIQSGEEHNFRRIKPQFKTATFDFNSIMLYSSYSYSVNGEPTITKLDGTTFEVTRQDLSKDDIDIIKTIYSNVSYSVPTVLTSIPSEITSLSATVGCEVTSDGNVKVTEIGIYWGTSSDPEKTGTKVSGTNTFKYFSTSLGDLKPSTTYYVKAYAINLLGTGYGKTESFTTKGISPIADFVAEPTNISTGQQVQFSDKSTNSPTSWLWNFGDSETSTLQNPLHLYANPGTFTVTLDVTNQYGSNTKTVNNYITVTGSAPVAGFEATTTSINLGETVNFNDKSTNNPTSWLWDFGDLETSTVQNPLHIYSNPGPFTVSLKASNDYGSDEEIKTNYIIVNAIEGNTGDSIFNPKLTYGSVSDVEGNTYKTIIIGTQTWMAENLITSMYSDGTPIPNVTDNESWYLLTTGAFCDYNNTPTISTIYGKLYNYYAVIDPRNLCPKGWHIPSYAEWDTLETYLGGPSEAGGKLKSLTLWDSPNYGATNETGFSALPGGTRIDISVNLGAWSFWWSSSQNEWIDYSANIKAIEFLSSYLYSDYRLKSTGISVRCIKDY